MTFRMGALALGALMTLGTVGTAFADGAHGHGYGGGMGSGGGLRSSAGIAGHAQPLSGSRFHSGAGIASHNSGAAFRGGFPLHTTVAGPRGSYVTRYPSSHYAGSRYSSSYPS